MYYQTFTVKGNGEFPLDMLRYDMCFPESQEDATIIANSFQSAMFEHWHVTIGRHIRVKNDKPTIDRWHSFGCKVENIKVR
jgi:hypothetical protein